jgi:hypothetical protein
MYEVHQKLAYNIDLALDSFEKTSPKINHYRKTLLSYAQGYTLETGIGTSRNLKYYPTNSKVLGINFGIKNYKKTIINLKELIGLLTCWKLLCQKFLLLILILNIK